MTTQPDVLRLAAELEACPTINYKPHAAELRRLHADVEAYATIVQYHEASLQRLRQANAELLELLKEAEYALDYASDMTKPEGMSGCDCPICSVSIKVRAAIAKATGEQT